MGSAILERKTKASTRSSIPQNWITEDTYTANQMIDTYLQGVKDGKDEVFNKLRKLFRTNLKNATEISENLAIDAKSKRVNFKSIHLRADDIYNFTVLFIIEKEDFLNEKFKKVLKVARNNKVEALKENFYINFNFVPFSANLNEKSILADGYFLKYDKK
jgi:hypothetical protein